MAAPSQSTRTLDYYISRQITRVAISHDGLTLAAGRGDGEVVIHELGTAPAAPQTIRVGDQQVVSLAFTPNSARLLVSHLNGQAYLYDRQTETCQFTTKDQESAAVCAALSRDGDPLVLLAGAGRLSVVNMTSGATLLECTGITSPVHAAFSPDDGRLLLLSNGQACVWDAAFTEERCVPLRLGSSDVWLAWSGRAESAATGGWKDLVVRDLRSGKEIWSVDRDAQLFPPLAISPTEGLLLECGANPTVRIRDLATGEIKHVLRASGPVTAAVFADEPGKVLLASSNDDVALWDTSTEKEIWRVTLAPE